MFNPRTGCWSVMKRLALAQRESGRYAGVALGLITDPSWPQEYEAELDSLGLPAYRRRALKMPGTLQHLYQMVRRPGIEGWVDDLAERTRADHVVVHFHNAWTSGAFVPIRSSHVPVSVVVTFHGIAGAAPLRRQPVRRWIHRRFARRLVAPGIRLTSVDAGCFGAAEELFGLERGRFAVVPNGMPPGTNEYGPFLRGLGCLTVAHVGSLTEDKGWRIAAEAVLSLAKAGAKIRCVIAGSGPQEAEAKQMVAQYPDCITFAGHVPDPCRTLLPSVDLFVLMTSNDGLPMAIIEAMSCGIPVISTRIGGIPDTVAHGESGFLVDRSVPSLAEVLNSLYRDRSRLASLSDNTKRIFSQRFDIAHVVRAYDSVYQGMRSAEVQST
jgi:glycosyltransferase involved in cell wall biosynthesis